MVDAVRCPEGAEGFPLSSPLHCQQGGHGTVHSGLMVKTAELVSIRPRLHAHEDFLTQLLHDS